MKILILCSNFYVVFECAGDYYSIGLRNNQLKRLESTVFKSPLNTMVYYPLYDSIDIRGSNIILSNLKIERLIE